MLDCVRVRGEDAAERDGNSVEELGVVSGVNENLKLLSISSLRLASTVVFTDGGFAFGSTIVGAVTSTALSASAFSSSPGTEQSIDFLLIWL